MNTRLLLFAFVATLGLVSIARDASASHNCSTTCSQSACSTDCNETDLRNAVSIINTCGGNRTLTFNAGAGCTINMAQTSTTAACTGDPEANAVCLTGNNTVIDGQNLVTFVYSGTGKCASDPAPSPQPALFTLKGGTNTVKNFTMKYFPEGIHLRSGSNHTVDHVTDRFICEDAITVDSTAGAGQQIKNSTLVGNTTAEAGFACYKDDAVTTGPCGVDKAIQINGGGATVDSNQIDTIGQPVHVVKGTHTISNNATQGSTTNQNVCQGYTVEVTSGNTGTVTFNNNVVDYCKWAIRNGDTSCAATGTASLTVTNNTLRNNYLAAVLNANSASAPSTQIKGQGNKMKNNGSFTTSDCQRGDVVVKCNANAVIDFGGGSLSSTGGNKFCSQGSLYDLWNSTGGSCPSPTGGGSNYKAKSNCFDPAPSLKYDPSSLIVSTPESTCTVSDCNF
jgi:hypothetical protein